MEEGEEGSRNRMAGERGGGEAERRRGEERRGEEDSEQVLPLFPSAIVHSEADSGVTILID